MKPLEGCAIGIAGLGLMGGAFAIALRERCGILQRNLLACDIDSGVLAAAEEEGLIGCGYSAENAGAMLAACDLVFICLCPSALMQFIGRWENAFKPSALVTDIAGVKSRIAGAAEKFRTDVDFIPGHPMAGAEKGGFANARLCNFQGKNYILTPLKRNKPENLAFLKDLIRRMGFACITETAPAEHDRKIAFTSQLCHVIAAALIDCEPDTAIARFGGGSFEDFTRIAMLNAPMWAELFTENRAALLERIDQFEGSLAAIKDLIQSEKPVELEHNLAKICEKRIIMSNR